MKMLGRRYFVKVFLVSLALVGYGADEAGAQSFLVEEGAGTPPLDLILPTYNDALFRGDGPGFYQYTDRRTKRGVTRPWQGGQYGFVRNIRETPYGAVFSRFHEGVDIKPVSRTADDEPLDYIHAIDDGVVVYVNAVEEDSNYGKYVVVEHWWTGSPFYSLYAHMASVHVGIGQEMQQGERLGRLGYTGVGINRRRAHVHFEINLLINRAFQPWYDDHFEEDDLNYHGIYSGLNLSGLNVPDLYLTLRDDASLTIQDFLERQSVFFTVIVPNEGMLDLLWRYPWLSPEHNAWTPIYGEAEPHAAWAISFARSGLPLRVEPSDRAVDEPVVVMLDPSPIEYKYLTNGLITGTDDDYTLTKIGLRHIDLLTRTPPPSPHGTGW